MGPLPFTTEAFLAVFANYNTALWPAQLAAYLLGAGIVAAALHPTGWSDRAAAAALALMWIVNGVAYHALFFAEINPAAYGFAALFAIQALLIGWCGLARTRLRFAWRGDAAATTGLVLVAYAAIAYPLLGVAMGHVWPAAPAFGLAPCPTTIFTLGMLLLARPPVPRTLLVIPVLWAAIGGVAAVALGMVEDYGLPVAALATLALILRRQRG